MRRVCAALAVGGFLMLSACAPSAPQGAQMAPQAMPQQEAPVQVTPPPAPPRPMPQSGMTSGGPVTGSKGSFGAPSTGVTSSKGSFGAPGSTRAMAKADPVYITKSGKKYHRADCQHLAKSHAPMARAQAQRNGYSACDVCKP